MGAEIVRVMPQALLDRVAARPVLRLLFAILLFILIELFFVSFLIEFLALLFLVVCFVILLYNQSACDAHNKI